MIVAIHQPNFLPWFGYFYKMSKVDQFVLLDHVLYTRNSYTRRVFIDHPKDDAKQIYIRVPLQKHRYISRISELKIDHQTDWMAKIIAQLKHAYSDSPNYEETMSFLLPIFNTRKEYEYLSHWNTLLIKELHHCFGFESTISLSSEMDLDPERFVIIEICKLLDAEVYVSGLGAKNYQDDLAFAKKNITLEYSSPVDVFDQYHIPQSFRNKSIVTWMMYYSKENILEMLKQ